MTKSPFSKHKEDHEIIFDPDSNERGQLFIRLEVMFSE